MRTALVLGGIVALLAASWPATAQVPPQPPASFSSGDVMEVTLKTSIHGSPGDKCVTGVLNPGDRVRVVRRSNDAWLEIVPPLGTVDYISADRIKRTDGNPGIGRVEASAGEFVPVMAANMLSSQQLLEVAKVQAGAQVLLVDNGAPTLTPSGSMVRITPVPAEVRYIKADAVRPVSAVQQASAGNMPLPGLPPLATATGQGIPPTSPLAQRSDPVIDLIKQKLTDPTLDTETRKRLEEGLARLQNSQQPAGNVSSTQLPGHPNGPSTAGGYPAAQLASRQIPPAQNTALYNNSGAAAPGAAAASKYNWSSYGILQKTNFQVDGQPAYRLLDKDGRPILYAAAEPGKTLDPYVGKMVTLYGPISYRSDEYIRMNFITAYYAAKANP